MSQVVGVKDAKIDSINYKVDGHHERVAAREVKPGGYVSENAALVTPHTEDGKRRAGWRIEYILLSIGVVWGLIIVIMVSAF